MHDVCPTYAAEFIALMSLLDQWNVSRRSLAVVPFFAGQRLSESAELVHALRTEAASGAEVVLHGWQHRFEGVHALWRNRIWSRFATRGCEEFACFSDGEAERFMRLGLAELADVLPGTRISGFTAPGWWMSKGSLTAASRLGFDFVTCLNGVFDVRAGRMIAAPVLTALPQESGVFGCLAEAWGWMRLRAKHVGVLRIALHPYDLSNSRFLNKTAKQLAILQRRNLFFRTYGDVLAAD